MFTDSETKIFGPYSNGTELIRADPLRIYRRLQVQLDGDCNKWLKQARSEDFSVAFQAKERIIPAVVFAFELAPFDPKTGAGCLEEDIISVLNSYLEFMDQKKENGESLRTCSLPTPASPPGR